MIYLTIGEQRLNMEQSKEVISALRPSVIQWCPSGWQSILTSSSLKPQGQVSLTFHFIFMKLEHQTLGWLDVISISTNRCGKWEMDCTCIALSTPICGLELVYWCETKVKT